METEWTFPKKLKAYNPKRGTKRKEVFSDPIALAIYTQYRRNHLIDLETDEFLEYFSLKVAEKIREARKENGNGKLTLKEFVDIWSSSWKDSRNPLIQYPYVKMSFSETKWEPQIAPILLYINGEKYLQLVKEYYLITKDK